MTPSNQWMSGHATKKECLFKPSFHPASNSDGKNTYSTTPLQIKHHIMFNFHITYQRKMQHDDFMHGDTASRIVFHRKRLEQKGESEYKKAARLIKSGQKCHGYLKKNKRPYLTKQTT